MKPARNGAHANAISGRVAHHVPDDLRKALQSDTKALAAWATLTPLARNEWICWDDFGKDTGNTARRTRSASVLGTE